MFEFIHSLEARQCLKGEIILDVLDQVQEVLMFIKGSFIIGFEINK